MSDRLQVNYRGTVFENGYGQIAKKVMIDERLSRDAKALYAYLISYAGVDMSAYPTVSRIMKELRIGSKDSYYKYLKELIDSGYITKEQGIKEDGKFGSNIYTIEILNATIKSNERFEPCPKKQDTVKNGKPFPKKSTTVKPTTVKSTTEKQDTTSNTPTINTITINNVTTTSSSTISDKEQIEAITNNEFSIKTVENISKIIKGDYRLLEAKYKKYKAMKDKGTGFFIEYLKGKYIDNQTIQSYPIDGSRGRHRSEKEIAALEEQLLNRSMRLDEN